MRPSSTKLYSSSRVCRWSGAASARGDIGCSTSEKCSPASVPSIMKRTPMLPRKPSLPLSGGTILGAVAAVVMDCSFSLYSSVAQNLWQTRAICQYSENKDVRPKASLPDEAPRRAGAGDPPPHHRERRRLARANRPRPEAPPGDRGRGGGAPVDRLPPLFRRGRIVRSLLGTLQGAEPSARPSSLGGDRGSRRTDRSGATGA